MNGQEIFDRVATHLLKQGRKSAYGQKCKYRAGKLRCAVGCLITDDAYDISIEYHGSDHPLVMQALRASGVKPLTEKTRVLLKELQDIHDAYDAVSWQTHLQELAERAGLNTKVLS